MLLAITEVDSLVQLRQLRERVDVGEHGALGIGGPAARDVPEHLDLPVEVGRLLCAVAHAEPGAGPAASVRGQAPVSHQRAQDELQLLGTEPPRLGGEKPVTGDQLPRWAPAPGRADKVVFGGRELRPAVSPGSGDGELKEPLGAAVVEPVHDPPGDDTILLGIVREHLHVQPLIDDLADFLLGAVRQGHPGRVRHAPEHDPDLFPQLVDEDHGGLRLVERTGELAQGLGHEPGLQADVGVPHLALDLGPGHQRGDRVDDDHVDRAGADQHVGDFQRLLAGVGLGDEQPVGVHPELLGVLRVERVLGVDEGGDPAGLLCVGGRVQRHGGLPAALRPVDLDDPAAGYAADAERDVQRDRPGRDHLDRCPGLVTEPHDRAPAELPLDLGERGLQGLLPVARLATRPVAACHGYSRRDQGLPVGPTLRAATDKLRALVR